MALCVDSRMSTSKSEETSHSDDSDEEGWGFLLGGLSTEAMSSTDWAKHDKIENENQKDHPIDDVGLRGRPDNRIDRPNNDVDKNTDLPHKLQQQQHQTMSERAFSISPIGQILKPPVRVLDRSSQNKGNVLVATQDIPKGSVIFTEKALEAIQVPSTSSPDLYEVRGCQNCFQSLEPASCMSSESIPFSELWPVPEYDGTLSQECFVSAAAAVESEKPIRMLLHAKSRRVTCPTCGVIFCNRYCAMTHFQRFGDCCKCRRAIEGLIDVMVRSESKRLFEGDDDDNEDCASFVEIDPVLVLATRMFLAQVQQHRADSPASNISLFDGLCGEAGDMRALGYEASPESTSDDTENSDNNLQPLQHEYEAIAKAVELTESERDNDWMFSLQEFHKLVAVAQRNSIALTTGSPFRTYYQAMLRKTGGRGSSRQQKVVSDVARLLGSQDGKLTRDMDRIVEEKCVVKMGGIFTLTAFMNHSCDPNAEIRGQEYVDCNVDIVAKEEIRTGEEICISYLNLGANPSYSVAARNRRQRQLRSRYMFHCQCSRCTERAP